MSLALGRRFPLFISFAAFKMKDMHLHAAFLFCGSLWLLLLLLLSEVSHPVPTCWGTRWKLWRDVKGKGSKTTLEVRLPVTGNSYSCCEMRKVGYGEVKPCFFSHSLSQCSLLFTKVCRIQLGVTPARPQTNQCRGWVDMVHVGDGDMVCICHISLFLLQNLHYETKTNCIKCKT